MKPRPYNTRGIMTSLKKELQHAGMQEYFSSNMQITKLTLHIRVLKQVLNILSLERKHLQFILDPETVFVHPQVSKYLYENVPLKDTKDVQIFYGGDYHPAREVEQFCDFLDSEIKDKNTRYHLNVAFGVDGFRGPELKNYRDNLRVGMLKGPEGSDWEEKLDLERHVQGVREMYLTHGPLHPEVVRNSIQDVFDKDPSAVIGKTGITYEDSVGYYAEEIKNIIETKYICFSEKP